MAYDILTTVASLKSWLKVTGSGDDAELGVLIKVASELVGRFCGRENLGQVYSYTENYFGRGSFKIDTRPFHDLVLRHFPVVSLTSVTMNNTPLTILNASQLQSNQSGVYLLEEQEQRILKFLYLYVQHPITVVYTAGYAPGSIPSPLQQAVNQYASEIFRSVDWLGVKSRAIAGETITYDTEGTWGMSKRVQLMLQPYRDLIPFKGY